MVITWKKKRKKKCIKAICFWDNPAGVCVPEARKVDCVAAIQSRDHCYFWCGITTQAHEKQSSWAPSLLQHRDRNNWASLKVFRSRIFKAWDVSSLSQGLAGVTDQIVFTDCAFHRAQTQMC